MSVLCLTESEARELLPMELALERVEASFRAQSNGHAENRSRQRILLRHCSLHYMAAALPEEKALGMKVYTITRQTYSFHVLLFDSETGELRALIQADHLGRIRTGAASGVATKYLARADATRVGMIGTGRQARTQLEAVAKVRKLDGAKVFGRDETRRLSFCREMSEYLKISVEPAATAEEAARFGDIVVTATTSHEAVVRGEWFAPGTHINAVGANMANRREVDSATLARASLIAVDSLEQSQKESGDLIQGFAELARTWEDVVELHFIVAGRRPGRNSQDEITLFKSNGIALWDVSVAEFIYRQALATRKGKMLEL